MFKKVSVPLRRFEVELKHRPEDDIDGSREELIESLTYNVPKMKNSDTEKQLCFIGVWGHLHSQEWRDRGINQAFIFTSGFKELLIRMEIKPFADEQCQTLSAPKEDTYNKWRKSVEKQFKTLYGITFREWEEQK